MADVEPSQIRIGDTERESAMAALGEHMSAGRLDIDEYGDRTARVTTARTRGELTAIFTDLPQPHPTLGPAKPVAAPAPTSTAPAPTGIGQTLVPFRQRVMAAAVPLAGIVAVVLFFAFHTWLFFLLPAVVVILGGTLAGNGGAQQRMARERYRQQQRDQRRRGRGW